MCARSARARQSRKHGLRRWAQRRRAFGAPGRGDAGAARELGSYAPAERLVQVVLQLVATAGTAAALGSFNEGWKREARGGRVCDEGLEQTPSTVVLWLQFW